MQSIIQKRFYNSARIFWLDKELLQQRIEEAIKKLILKYPLIKKIVLFGSAADKRETPSSDVDILIIVDDSKLRFFDRPSPFKEYFQDVGLEVDIFVYTCKEVREDIPLVNNALKRGKVLFGR